MVQDCIENALSENHYVLLVVEMILALTFIHFKLKNISLRTVGTKFDPETVECAILLPLKI